MKRKIISFIKKADEFISQKFVNIFEEKNSLITFLFHGMFNNDKELDKNLVLPQQEITTKIFCQFIEYFLEQKYYFVSPEDMIAGLESDKKYVLITFDDGYYNNVYSLPILKEYKVPATFFISAGHIAENKCFWWDVIYRERVKRNVSNEKIKNELISLKKKKHDEIEALIIDHFGKKALIPISDTDRPFTPLELKSFSEEPFVFLGNHTSNHAILTNYTYSEIMSEIADAQNSIFSFTGKNPLIISYPSGYYSDEVLAATKENGFDLGITVNHHKNYLPINFQGNDSLLLGRHILWGNKDVKKQCEIIRSDLHMANQLKNLIRKRT